MVIAFMFKGLDLGTSGHCYFVLAPFWLTYFYRRTILRILKRRHIQKGLDEARVVYCRAGDTDSRSRIRSSTIPEIGYDLNRLI